MQGRERGENDTSTPCQVLSSLFVVSVLVVKVVVAVVVVGVVCVTSCTLVLSSRSSALLLCGDIWRSRVAVRHSLFTFFG